MANFNLHKNIQNNKTLGRGLSSLIPKKDSQLTNKTLRRPVSPAAYLPKKNAGLANQIIYLSPNQIIINPYQPRQNFGEQALESLKKSIQQHGILQPLVVTQTMGGKYELVAGERRLRAAKELNLKKIPVIIRTVKDLEKLELSLIENIQREDLNPIEKAQAYKQLIENFHLTQEEAAKRLGVARSTLNNTLRLLQLPPEVQKDVATGKISEGQAKLILSLNNPQQQKKITQRAKEVNYTVKDIEREIKRIKVKAHTRQIKKDPQIEVWERRLQQKLGTKALIRKRGQQGGVIEIEFYSSEELKNIIKLLI